MIILPRRHIKNFERMLRSQREVIVATKYHKRDKMRILLRYDEYLDTFFEYITGKVIMDKLHFNHLWGENQFIILDGSKSVSAIKAHNTASKHIDAALRKIGKEYGWMEES